MQIFQNIASGVSTLLPHPMRSVPLQEILDPPLITYMNFSQVEEMVKHTEYALGPIDILVNNAGIMYYTMMKNLKVDEWEKQIDLNCKVL